jgi:hypothetical protein
MPIAIKAIKVGKHLRYLVIIHDLPDDDTSKLMVRLAQLRGFTNAKVYPYK